MQWKRQRKGKLFVATVPVVSAASVLAVTYHTKATYAIENEILPLENHHNSTFSDREEKSRSDTIDAGGTKSIKSGPCCRLDSTTQRWYLYKGIMNPASVKDLKIFKCSDTPLADEIAHYLGVSLNAMQIGKFVDDETKIVIEENVRGCRVYVICSTTSVDRILELLLTISAMRRSWAKSITAVIPFYGYGRQDRMHKGREPIAAADIAEMLQVMGVDHVMTIDLHSAQIEGFFRPTVPVDNLQAYPIGSYYFAEKQLKNPVVVAPHSSAVNRAVLFSEILSKQTDESIPVAFVIRKHHVVDQSVGELVGNVKGMDAIIVDNLVDTGDTLIKTAKVLKQHGARTISAFCVHGRFSANAIEKLTACEELNTIVTTNTIPNSSSDVSAMSSDKIITLSVAPFLAQMITSTHTNESFTFHFN
ncbi:hypothetical protein ABG067_001980 [Albugo candida]